MKNPLLFIFLCISTHSWCQYQIDIKIQTSKDSLYMIAYSLPDGKTLYPQDTIKADGHNNLVFEGAKKLPEGMYYLIKGRTKVLEFPLVASHLKIEADMDDFDSVEIECIFDLLCKRRR